MGVLIRQALPLLAEFLSFLVYKFLDSHLSFINITFYLLLEPPSTQPPDLVKSQPTLLSDLDFSECLQDSSSTFETDSSVWDSPGDRPRRLYSDVLTGSSSLNDWNPKEQPPIPGEQNSPSKEDCQVIKIVL